MSSYSIYADAESAPPDWKPGEEQASTAFLALTFWLILDINIGIYRVFRKKQGLYFWTLVIGTWACAVGTIGNVLKNLTPQYGPKIWPLWTVLISGGWSLFAVAECLLLYSRLHLVNRSHKIQRRILILIIVGSILLVVPNWVFIFPAYDVDPNVSSIWSPRQAVIDRIDQLGFTLIETAISFVYIWSLAQLLRVKSTVRQRVVMLDLLYVNIIVICIDLVVSILIFLNQTNLSFSIQDFSYALKFKMEFVVLNQLMAVAAKGVRKESFAERRYNQLSTQADSSAGEPGKAVIPLEEFAQDSKRSGEKPEGFEAPSPAHIQNRTPRDKFERIDTDEQPLHLDQFSTGGSDTTEIEMPPKPSKKDSASYDIHLKSDEKSRKHRSLRHPLGQEATMKVHRPKEGRKRKDDEDDEEEEIGVHMWENRGKLVLDVPWLQDDNTT